VQSFLVRLLSILIGLMLLALGVVITIKANIGYAPWEVFHVGLANTIGLTIGVVAIITGIVIVIIVTALGEKVGFGTLVNMVLVGVFIDVIIMLDFIPTANNFVIGITMLTAGMFIISFASFFYIRAAFGAGPRDSLMVVLARKTKAPIGLCRFMLELSITLIGWFLGGMVGIGTIISAFAIGVCIQITFSVVKFDVTAVKHETLSTTLSVLSGKAK